MRNWAAILTIFVGCLDHADDMLLSEIRTGLQEIVSICKQYFKKKGLMFTSNPDSVKSKTHASYFKRMIMNAIMCPLCTSIGIFFYHW